MRTKSFAEKLQQKVEQHNQNLRDNYARYVEVCHDQKVEVGQPIDIMSLIKKEKEP